MGWMAGNVGQQLLWLKWSGWAVAGKVFAGEELESWRVEELECRLKARGVLNDPYGSRTLTREAYSTDRETPASSQAANDTVLA
jgi:hypothetical protein